MGGIGKSGGLGKDGNSFGLNSYATLASLPGTGTANTSYKVTNDPTPSNNGYYHWNGSAYVKDYDSANGNIKKDNVDAVNGGKIFEVVKYKSNLKTGKNLFDKSDIKSGFYLTNTGAIFASASYSITGYIKVSAQQYKSNRDLRYTCYFDEEYNLVGGGESAFTSTFIVPSGVAYMRCTYAFNDLNTLQIEVGSVVTTYEAFKLSINENEVPNLSTSELIETDQNKGVNGYGISNYISNELFYQNLAPQELLQIGILGSTNGLLSPSAGWKTTGFIDCFEAEKMYSTNFERIVFYDINKNYISGFIIGGSLNEYTVPAGAYYCRFTFTDAQAAQCMVSTVIDIYKLSYNNNRVPIINQNFLKTIYSVNDYTPLSPNKIYTVCNDIIPSHIGENAYKNRGYSCNIYLDRLFNFTSKPFPKIRFKDTQSDKFPLFSKTTSETVFNEGVNIKTTPIVVSYDGDNENSIAFDHVNIKATVGKTTTPKILCIGDSVTNGVGSQFGTKEQTPQQYWKWIKQLFEMDKIDDGDGTTFDALMLGTFSSNTTSFDYNGVNRQIKTYAEGRGAWKITDYAFNRYIGGDTDTGHYTGENPFWDGTTYTSGCKFSLNKYLAQFKTLADDGVTRLAVGTTAGTSVTNVNNYDVCTPTHIIFQLGVNDTDNFTTAYNNLLSIITNIRNEGYTTIKIGIGLSAYGGTYYPELYPNIDPVSSLRTTGGIAERLHLYNEKFKDFENVADVNYIPIYFTQPTAGSLGLRPVDNVFSIEDGDATLGVPDGFQPLYHPNVNAHLSFAYQYYAWLKSTL